MLGVPSNLRIAPHSHEHFQLTVRYCQGINNFLPLIIKECIPISQCAKRIFDKIAKAINKTHAGLKFMLQGFGIYFL